jgi:uncharacterized UBP type Zn finger protein
MAEQKIPANLKRLLDYGTMKDEKEPREYKFYDFEGKVKIVHLSSDDILAEKLRCPRDGVRIANYSGDPHRVSECPNCGYSPCNELYPREKEVATIASRIREIESELATLKAKKEVVQNPNHLIVKANQRDDAMND